MKAIQRRRVLRAFAIGAAGGSPLNFANQAFAQTQPYPLKPIKLVVGASTGGPSDFLARLMADTLSPILGQSVVVENKPGGSGMPAADAVAKSPADGYTLLVSGPASIVSMPQLAPKISYNANTDLTPVMMLGAGPFSVVVHPSVPAKNIAELIAYAKANPSKVLYGSGGMGSSGHLLTEYFSSRTGAKMLHIPYKGDGQAVVDLVGGQIQVMFTAPNVVATHVKAGRLRELAMTSQERSATYRDVPVVSETIKSFDYLGWIIVFAPAGTPPAAINALTNAWAKVRNTPAVKEKLDSLAMAAPERLAERATVQEFVKVEYERIGKVIREAQIKID